ncbi:hypothetical protein Cni_G14981 [Canna indica]|uniref:Uncharacterized protein n=1 Tax=Canna indica TaxID=4628 RepID=A0AAQ3KCL8_9LILI|nr:hypothetical protein Cni_G14981 [Canna indica]
MAQSSKLKQSSMDSFLHHHPKPKPTAVAEPKSPTAASDYERIRRETIRRNQEFLLKLGISSASAAPPKTIHHASSRRSKPPPVSLLPLRRSSRNKPPPPAAEDVAPDLPEPSFVDSFVFQYACLGAEPTEHHPRYLSKASSSPHPVVGFRVLGKGFRDPSLSRIYSIDVCSSKKDRFLLAAGGHGGFISIYGGEWDAREEDSEGEMIDHPLMSWKGSRSWISAVRFVEDNPMLLVSSSNDGAVVVWDVKKQPALSSLSTLAPPVVAKSTGLHSGGIYSMDRRDWFIATASKDSSVGVSRLTPAGELIGERDITGHHSGVIRGICFGDRNEQLVDCGADGRICVLDTRMPEPCTLTIESLHSTGVNTIEWSKTNKFLLLSASKDPTLHLYDIRRPAEPVHTQLHGHVDSNTTCSQIYRPCFVGGKTIATPGQGSRKISLYDVDEENLISQGFIGYDANLVIFTDYGEHPRLWAAGRHINQLALY